MDIKVMTMKEIKKDNPTLCISPLRVFNKCFECPKYKQAEKLNQMDKIGCNPQIDKRFTKLLERKTELLRQIEMIDKEMIDKEMIL